MGSGPNPQPSGKPQAEENRELEEGIKKDTERKEVSRNTERWLNVLKEARQPPFDKTLLEKFAGDKSCYILERAGPGFENAIELDGAYTIRLYLRLDVADLDESMHVEEYSMIVEGLSKFFKGEMPEGLSVEKAEEFVNRRNELVKDLGPAYMTGGNYKEGGEVKSMRAMRLSIFVPNVADGRSGSKKHVARQELAEELGDFMQEYMRFNPEECARFKERHFKLRDGVDLDNKENIGLEKIGKPICPRYAEKFASEKWYGGGDENEVRRFIVLNTLLSSEFVTEHRKKGPQVYTPAGYMRNIGKLLKGEWDKPERDPIQEFTDALEENCQTWRELSPQQKETYRKWLEPAEGRNAWFHLIEDSFAGSTENYLK
jgi:hypothetical protein